MERKNIKRKWQQGLSFLLTIVVLFTSGIVPDIVQAESNISRTASSNYSYYCNTCGFYYASKESHKERISCSTCNGTGNKICNLCNGSGILTCGQEGTYTQTVTQGPEVPSGMMDSVTHVPTGTKVPNYYDWTCHICNTTGSWTWWVYYNVPGIAGDDGGGVRPTDISAHTYGSIRCTQCNGTGQYGGQCSHCDGLGAKELSSFCTPEWKYRVDFYENGGSCTIKSAYYTGNTTLPTASKEGYRFLGWNTSSSASTGSKNANITAPICYFAIYEKLGNATFIDAEGPRTVMEDSESGVIPSPQIRGHYNGAGWTEETEPDSATTKDFQNGKTYYARYYTYGSIDYDMGQDEKGLPYAGISEKPQGDYGHSMMQVNAYDMTAWKGSSYAAMATAPEWKGHQFLGWSDGNKIYAPGEYPPLWKLSTTFTALWKLKANTIKLDSQGATSSGSTSVEVVAEEAMPEITPPKKEYTITFNQNTTDSNTILDTTYLKNSYMFDGYYTAVNGGGIQYYNADGFGQRNWDKTEDITLYALWSNPGIELPNISRNGYAFLGWSTSPEAVNGMAAGTNYKASAATTLYAIWKKNTYTITYDLAGGIVFPANPSTYDVETATFQLNNPVKEGYLFIGWTGSDGDDVEKNISIVKGSVGNKNYTAHWIAKSDTSYQVVVHRETLQRDYSDSSTDIVIEKKGTSDTKVNAETIASSYQYEGFSYSYAKAQDSIARGATALELNIDRDGTAELHLYYTRNEYQLTIGDYDPQKVTTSNISTTLLYGEKIKLKASARSGYKFSHWDSADTSIQPDLTTANVTMQMVASNISMTPVVNDITYTIEFEANDTNSHTPENNVRATAVPKSQEYDYNEEISMPDCTRKGFRFLGWSTSKNGSPTWTVGEKVSQLSSVDKAIIKLYAQWEEYQYSIQFHANDDASTAHNPTRNVQATGTTASTKSYYYTDYIQLPNSNFIRTGFTFRGWSITKGSNAVEYKPGDLAHNLSETANGIVTLYAAWSEKSYSITFEPGDSYCYGSENGITAKVSDREIMDTTRVYYTDGFTMPSCSYTRKGFTFLGWSENKNASKKTYTDDSYQGELQPGDQIPDLNTIETHLYYPVWKENCYTITYHRNDTENTAATGTMASKTAYYTECFHLAKNEFSRTGFTFRGWSTIEGSNEVSYTKEEEISRLAVSGIIDLYAVWKENFYKISFQPNDNYCYGTEDGVVAKVSNSDAMDTIYLGYTEIAVFPECAYNRKGFTFLGWSENKKDSQKTYEQSVTAIQPGTEISFLSDTNNDELVYYPVWKENQYTIMYDPNDENNAAEPTNEPKAEGTMASIRDIYYTQEITLNKNQFIRTGFDYKGWSDTKSNNTLVYGDREAVRKLSYKDEDIVTLYAAWKEHSYTLHFKPGDGYCYGSAENVNIYVSNSNAMPSVVLKYTENWKITTSYERIGFTFVGYSYQNDNKKMYQKGYKIPFTSGETLTKLSSQNKDELIVYTIWKENTYQIKFHANDSAVNAHGTHNVAAEGVMEEQDNIYYTEKITLSKNNFARKGFCYKGWSIEENKNEVAYNDEMTVSGLTFEDGKIFDLYAAWDENYIQIHFDSNDDYCYGIKEGVSANTEDVNAMKEHDTKLYYTDEFILPECNYTRKGFAFQGWSRDKSDVKKLYPENIEYERDFQAPYQPGDSVFGLSEAQGNIIIFYPLWKEDQIMITFDKNARDAIWNLDKTVKKMYYTENWSITELPVYTGYQFLGYAENRKAEKADFLAGETLSKLLKNNHDGAMITLYAIWSVKLPEMITQTKNIDIDREIKPYHTMTISVSAIGVDLNYQWYYMDANETIGTVIEGAIKESYVIPAEDIIEVNDGRSYYCIITNQGGQIRSEPVTIHIYGTPNAPTISAHNINERGWSNENICFTLSGSTIKGSEKQVSYLYSMDGITWAECDDLLWQKNTLPEGETISFKACNQDCPELESSVITYTVRKDDEKPTILNIVNRADYIIATESAITIYADDSFSGVFRYAVVNNGLEERDWQERNTFEVTTGTYQAYVMDTAGNITRQGFEVYANGYILLNGSSGSYTNGDTAYVVGNGMANWEEIDIDRSKITSIIIENGITEIPGGFFEGFINLKDLTIPDSVIAIGEHAFDSLPETMVIHASKNSEGEKAAEKYHYTEYNIIINGIDDIIHAHYHEEVFLPKEEVEKDGKTLVGWGTKPEEKEFEREERISGLSDKMNGILTIYPIYTDAYIDENGRLHITGDNTNYLNDIIHNKDNIQEIIVESGVTILPKQIPDDFKNLMDLTLPESLKEIPKGSLNSMPDGSVIHAPEGSKAAEEAERIHHTNYSIKIDGTEEEIQANYNDKIKLPETAPEKEGYLFIGWGTTNDKKEFDPGEVVSSLTGIPDKVIILYPIYEKVKKEDTFINNELPPVSDKNSGTIIDSIKESSEENKENDHTEKESDIIKTPDIKDEKLGYYMIEEDKYHSLEEVLDSLLEREVDQQVITAYGDITISDDFKIPERATLIIRDKLTISDDITLLGNMIIEEYAEVLIEGILTAQETSNITVKGKLSINGTVIVNGHLYLSETGIIYIFTDGICKVLPEGFFENKGDVQGNIIDDTQKEVQKKETITIKIRHSTIVVKKGNICTVKPIKGVTKWSIKNKKIASLKKKNGNLILTGKKNGKTVLIGKRKNRIYRYVVCVKTLDYNKQIKLTVKGKVNNKQQILTASGIVTRNLVVKRAEGKVTIKLLWAGDNVKWKISGNGILKKKGNKAIVIMNQSKKCVLTAKYQGKSYQCYFYQ